MIRFLIAGLIVLLSGCILNFDGTPPHPDTDWTDASASTDNTELESETLSETGEEWLEDQPESDQPPKEEPQQPEESDSAPETDEPDTPDPVPSEPVGPESISHSPPNPLAAAPPPKAKYGRPNYWLFCYGGNWCPACRYDRPKLQAWANKHGLPLSEYNIQDSLMATVVLIDITRDRVQRDLQYDKPNPALFPTYVLVDAEGSELWHHVGPIDISTLDFLWDVLN